MSPLDEEFDDLVDPERDELWNYVPMRRNPMQDPVLPGARRGSDAVHNPAPEPEHRPWKQFRKGSEFPQSTSLESTQVPWKRSQGRTFVADDAIIRSGEKRPLMPTRLSGRPVSGSGTKYRVAGWLAGVAMITAAGVVGYELSPGSSPPLSQPVFYSNRFEQSGLVSGQSRQSDASAELTASAANTSSTEPESPRRETSTIAAKMRTGVELMTYGEVIKARMMFQRVAEAGQGDGAFALAETYDPLVLQRLRLSERIVPDLALAHGWYERARDLGSPEARDRISRLAQSPH